MIGLVSCLLPVAFCDMCNDVLDDRGARIVDTTRDFTTDFDHFDPVFVENMATVTADLRARCPVAHGKAYGGFWVFSRYDDIMMAIRDEKTFSSKDGTAIPWVERDIRALPVESDPPEHTKYRNLLASWFVARKVNRYESIVRRMVTELINAFIEQGTCDFIASLAMPLAVSVIPPAMGFEPKEWPLLTNFMKDVLTTTDDENIKARHRFVRHMFREMERRKTKPRDDFLTTLVMAQPDGEPLSGEEVVALMITFLTAGFETTSNALGNLLLCLIEYPHERQALIDTPASIPLFVEESLRYEPPLQYVGRNLKQDLCLHGQELQTDQKVFLLLGSANRDEARFPNAGQFIPDRQPNRHVTFGYGVHFCVGAPLARLQMRIATEEVLRRLPDYQLCRPVKRAFSTGQVYGVETLPVVFTPGNIERLSQDDV